VCSSHDQTGIGDDTYIGNDSNSGQRRAFLCLAAGPRGVWLADVADSPGSVLAPASGDDGYSCPGAIGAASYAGRRDFLELGFLRDEAGGGVESVSFELARLDLTTSSSSVSDELGSFGCEKRLGGGTRTEDSAVVDGAGMCTGLFKDSRPEEELPSGTGTLYRARGSGCPDSLGLVTAPFARADGIEYGDVGNACCCCDGEATAKGINPGGSCPLGGSVKTGWLGLPAGPTEPPWGTTGDDDGSITEVDVVGDVGRLWASSALRKFLCETYGVACGVCD
jgi:hypothetical protein